MMTTQAIGNLDHPALAPYKTMKAQHDHHQQGIFVAEGEKIVRRLLETNFTVKSVLLPEKWLESFRPLIEPRPEMVEVFIAEKEVLERLIGFSMYQGVLAVGVIPAPARLEEILETAPKPRFFVAVDGLNNSENMGVLVRNCTAFGVQALIQGETSSSPYMRRAVRSSMGTIFRLPVVETVCLAHTLRALRDLGIHTVAAHPHTDKRYLSQARLDGDCCIVFGSEGYGLSSEVLASCDEAVAIPMANNVDSLNVGSASAVFCYEAARQRNRA